MWLVAQPEIAYLKDENIIHERFLPLDGMFFQATVIEVPDDIDIKTAQSYLIIGDKPFIRGDSDDDKPRKKKK